MTRGFRHNKLLLSSHAAASFIANVCSVQSCTGSASHCPLPSWQVQSSSLWLLFVVSWQFSIM